MYKFHKNVYRCQMCGDINRAKRRISPKSYIIGIPYIISGIFLIVFPALLLPWIALGYFIFFRRECEKCHSKNIKIVGLPKQKQESSDDQVHAEIKPISEKETDPFGVDPNMGYAEENPSVKYGKNAPVDLVGKRMSETISMFEKKGFGSKPFFNNLIITVVLIFVLFAWIESFDDSATTYLKESLNEALVVYGTSRAANALISVLQTAHVPGFLAFGQALDPLNSLIERFSALMELSIASILIQLVLVKVFSDLGFTILVSITGIALAVAMLFNSNIVVKPLAKLFTTMVFLRFALVSVILVCAAIDDHFVSNKIKSDQQRISWIDSHTAVAGNIPASEADTPQAVESTGLIEKARSILSKGKDQIKSTLALLNPIEIKKKLDAFVPNVLNLMALFFLKTILLPLIFLYVFKRLLLVVWDVDISNLGAGKLMQKTKTS